MREVVIENPVINSAFAEPRRHFKFDDDGITSEIVESRRPSAYFIPVAQPKKKGKQLQLGTEWTEDRLRENDYINEVRTAVADWRARYYPGITRTTRRLLEYWRDPRRDRRLFFCQVEAVETAIFLTEYAPKLGNAYLLTRLHEANEGANPGLDRIAFKMATGSGKTVVMAMLIAWHALNKIEAPQDARFSDAFLIVAPGITIRDRLRVLLPNDGGNYYRRLDVVPVELSFFLKGVVLAADGAIATARDLTRLFEKDRERIQAAGRRAGSALRIHEAFKARPLLKLTEACLVLVCRSRLHHRPWPNLWAWASPRSSPARSATGCLRVRVTWRHSGRGPDVDEAGQIGRARRCHTASPQARAAASLQHRRRLRIHAGRAGGIGWARRGLLQLALAVVGAHGEGVAPLLPGPLVAPDHPGERREWLPQFGLLPGTTINLNFNLRDSAGAGVGDAADGHVPLSIPRHEAAGVDGVDRRTGPHLSLATPAARDPVAGDEVRHQDDLGDPLGLLHSVDVGDVDAQGKAVLCGQWLAVPGMGQHDARV